MPYTHSVKKARDNPGFSKSNGKKEFFPYVMFSYASGFSRTRAIP
ncbi:hypothetical protein LEP1GSC052_3190 [Leptospira kmetyi serovar Malaysia str. Bejo-Iso9]|nr:hypothetical protein LEP1GSC052_3190 [Leptospira kmetyi serovar Malaysia str. Bejo-Iso9]